MTEIPVLVGIAQLEQRPDDPTTSKEPLALMLDALRAAAEDAGSPELLRRADSIRVVRGRWPYKNPAAVIAAAIGADGAETGLTRFGGNFVQSTLNRTALDIQSGRHDIVLLTGAECGSTQAKATRAGLNLREDLDWQAAPGEPDLTIGEDVAMAHPYEISLGIVQPIQVYPMMENSLRHHLGESIEAHIKRVSERALNIPETKWIYPWTGTDAHDPYVVSNRDTFYESPAIRIAGRRALELAGLSASDVDHVDVYSCFPVAVQVAAREIGLDQSRPLTVTGGLTFGGGPLNNYVMHSIARMAEVLRDDREAKGLVTANGGYLTKHAFGVYSAMPPAKPFQHQDVQAEVDRTPTREVLETHEGRATVESYTVMYRGEAPAIGYLSALTDDGRRTWAKVEDRDTLAAMTREEYCGRSCSLSARLAHF
jgi:acetyl-CoA C-acetyltransferase